MKFSMSPCETRSFSMKNKKILSYVNLYEVYNQSFPKKTILLETWIFHHPQIYFFSHFTKNWGCAREGGGAKKGSLALHWFFEWESSDAQRERENAQREREKMLCTLRLLLWVLLVHEHQQKYFSFSFSRDFVILSTFPRFSPTTSFFIVVKRERVRPCINHTRVLLFQERDCSDVKINFTALIFFHEEEEDLETQKSW